MLSRVIASGRTSGMWTRSQRRSPRCRSGWSDADAAGRTRPRGGGGVGRGRREPGGPGAEALRGGGGEGSRAAPATRLIGRYSQMRPPLSRAEIERFMLVWAASCEPPFDESVVLEKVNRLFKA